MAVTWLGECSYAFDVVLKLLDPPTVKIYTSIVFKVNYANICSFGKCVRKFNQLTSSVKTLVNLVQFRLQTWNK